MGGAIIFGARPMVALGELLALFTATQLRI